jgi:xanthine phosphoribosyltransferase
MEKINVSFNEIDFYARTIADRLKDRDITHVVGLARGGVIPATIMCYVLDKPLLTTGVRSYEEDKKTKDLLTYQPLNIKELKEVNAHVLIVDDICDSGETMTYISDQMTLANVKRTNVCIFTKEKHKEWLDHYGLVVSDNKWIVFPWE